MELSRRDVLLRSAAAAAGVAAGGVPLGSTKAQVDALPNLYTGLRLDNLERAKIKLGDYLTADLPDAPANFGHFRQVTQTWDVLGNDTCGDCFFAGSAHEHMVFGAEASRNVRFSTDGVVRAYSDLTKYDPSKADPITGANPTDVGTVPLAGMAYRQKTGIPDINGEIHKLDAYAEIDHHNIDLLATVAYLFGSAGIGVNLPKSAMFQFQAGKTWDVDPSSYSLGGHYVPLVGRFMGMFIVVTWGKLQLVTRAFLETYLLMAYATFSKEMLVGDRSPEGIKGEELLDDVRQVTK